MRPNGTFRQADLRRIFTAAKEAGIALELELLNGNLKIRPLAGDKGSEQPGCKAETEDLKDLL